MDIKGILLLLFINILMKSLQVEVLKTEIKQNQRQLVKELHKLIIRNLKKEEFIHQLKTMFGVLI